jgi:hypothetical protein
MSLQLQNQMKLIRAMIPVIQIAGQIIFSKKRLLKGYLILISNI